MPTETKRIPVLHYRAQISSSCCLIQAIDQNISVKCCVLHSVGYRNRNVASCNFLCGHGKGFWVRSVKSLVNTDSHPSMHIMVLFFKSTWQRTCTSLFPMWKLNFLDSVLCPALLKKLGTTELKDELCNTWHENHGVKRSFVSAAGVAIYVQKLFSVVVASN